MLLVVCPNLAVDRILQVENFQPNEVQRSRSVIVQPGGKGANVARVFRQMSGQVVLVGFAGRQNRRWLVEELTAVGVRVDPVEAFETNRTCTIICDSRPGLHPAVINEESPGVEASAAARLLEKVARWVPRAEGVLTTGSLPQGLPADFYAAVIDFARSRGKLTAIDATGSALRSGLRARPEFMKPNTAELRELLAGSTISMLAAHTAFTFGTAGAALLHEGKCIYGPPPRIFDVNPVGAGDSFVAGYLKSLLQGDPPSSCLRRGMAAAACDSGTLRPGYITRPAVDRLSAQVELRFTVQN
jgi:1-phosphofructokinase family hexose kinase